MDRLNPSVAQSASDVSSALASRSTELSAEINDLILREIPELRRDMRVEALLAASVDENVATLLHVLEHGIDLDKVHAPAAAQEYARRLAQRGVPIAALLRAYRIGSTRFQERCLEELGSNTSDARLVSAAGLRIADITAAYIDRVSEELVSAYEIEKSDWQRNLSAARAARVRALLADERVDTAASEAILGYRLRQHHVGVLCWSDKADIRSGSLGRLEHAAAELARSASCDGSPLFVPQDESSAWAWLPLGGNKTFAIAAAPARPYLGDGEVRFAVGSVGHGLGGFRRTHQQALGAYSVAVAAGPSGQFITNFSSVAPLALMSGATDLTRHWVMETLGPLADDDDYHATLRATLRTFLEENGSFKATAERMTLHKNTVQYRIRKATASLGRPVGEDRLQIELALLAGEWLGAAVLRHVGPGRP